MLNTRKTTPFWRTVALAALTSLVSGHALAQWQWLDGKGKTVFSDTPPPASVPDKNILKRAGGSEPVRPSQSPIDKSAIPRTASTPPAASGSAAGDGKPAAEAAPKISGKDTELEAKKKKADDAEKAARKAAEEKQARARADNCARVKQAKATLDSGVRIATTNAQGEREIMDEAARSAEAKRLDGIAQSDCGPAPVATK